MPLYVCITNKTILPILNVDGNGEKMVKIPSTKEGKFYKQTFSPNFHELSIYFLLFKMVYPERLKCRRRVDVKRSCEISIVFFGGEWGGV
jgi:hypothetical protein